MATRTRVSSVPGREKRGTSPSHTTVTAQQQQQHHHHRTSPNTSKTSSPARQPSDISSDHKHSVPNYLTNTLSSGTDENISRQQGKKPNNTTAKRRSLDKPPSSSNSGTTQKPHNPTLRSSSLSGKTVPRQVHDKNLKPTKEFGKQGGSLYTRPVNAVKKRTIYVKKQGTGNSSISTTTKEHDTTRPSDKLENPNTPKLTEPETKTDDQLSSEEQITVDETNHEERDDAPTNEDQEKMTNIEKTEAVSDKDVIVVNIKSPNVLEQLDLQPDVDTEEGTEEKPQTGEISSSKQQELEHAMNETNSNTNDQIVTENQKEEVAEKQGEAAAAAASKHKEEDGIVLSADKESNEKEVQEVDKEEKQEPVSAAAPKLQQAVLAQGKKESAVSNNVIEETASKLREQRKNKVKALAGAFETVISLQEPK